MKKTLTTLTAAAALGVATVAVPAPSNAMDPWTAAAWFVGGVFVGGLVAGPAYAAYPYGYRYSYAYSPVYAAWGPAPTQCYWTTMKRGGVWRNAQVCY
jgi:hypothetical protein